MRFRHNKHSAAPVSKDGAAPWFETPRTRLRNLANSKLPAPHHEAGRDRGCIKLIGICFSAADLKFLHHLQQTRSGTSNRKAALES